MANKTSLYKVRLDIADLDQHRYQKLTLTVALGKNESLSHLVMRLIAFAMVPEDHVNASQGIRFGHGVCDGTEPDVMVVDYFDHYLDWIDIGFPTVERLRKASYQTEHLLVYTLADSVWFEANRQQLMNLDKLQLIKLDNQMIEDLSLDIGRCIDWSLVIDGNKLGISDKHHYYESAIHRTGMSEAALVC